MKRLICCLDGTWNDDKDEAALTNVVKLHRAISPVDAAGVPQLSKYVVGIATGYSEGAYKFGIGSLGLEVADRIRTAYLFLAENYEPGDEIHLFGFSRGAFQARSLAGLIGLLGIARRDAAFDFDAAWSGYRDRMAPAAAGTLARLRSAAHYPVRIKCVGVWDTVGNIGNPFYSEGRIGRAFKFHDTRLSATVDVGLHALSIDEKRGPFRPTLWTLPMGGRLPENQHVEQVWFAGVHADVGGGYAKTGLSDIGLLWMAERVVATTDLAIDLVGLWQRARPDPLAVQHSSTLGRIFRWSGRLPYLRLVLQDERGIPPLRRALIGTWRTSLVPPGEVPVNEAIHESVLARFGKTVTEVGDTKERQMVYAPPNLAAVLQARDGAHVAQPPGPAVARPFGAVAAPAQSAHPRQP